MVQQHTLMDEQELRTKHIKGRKRGKFSTDRPEAVSTGFYCRLEPSLAEILQKVDNQQDFIRRAVVRELVEQGQEVPENLREYYGV